jgi:hypothetical protein
MKECGECSRVSNNKQFNCPPRMDDGRHFTDYRPRCLTNYMFPKDVPINSYEYRQYLILNAEKLMESKRIAAYEQNACGPCMEPYDVGTMLPEQSMQECNTSTCKIYPNDQNGLGLGRQFMSVDEESRAGFMRNKQREQNHMKNNLNCCTSVADDMNYFPLDGMVEQEYARPSIPGGGEPFSGGSRVW